MRGGNSCGEGREEEMTVDIYPVDAQGHCHRLPAVGFRTCGTTAGFIKHFLPVD